MTTQGLQTRPDATTRQPTTRKVGWEFKACTAAMVASVVGLFFLQECNKLPPETIRKGDGICHPKEREQYIKDEKGKKVQNPLYSEADCPPCRAKEAKADPNDGKCKIANGEHDIFSSGYDKSCGFCGDGKQQEWETAENCPVDFHCENGILERNTLFAAVIKEDGKYRLGTVKITESCKEGSPDNCDPVACENRTSRRGSRRREREDESQPISGKCPKPTATQKGMEIRDTILEEWSEIEALRKRVTPYKSSTVTAIASMDVSGGGVITKVTSVLRCRATKKDEPCANPSAPGPSFNKLAKNKNIGNQGRACNWTVSNVLTAP